MGSLCMFVMTLHVKWSKLGLYKMVMIPTHAGARHLGQLYLTLASELCRWTKLTYPSHDLHRCFQARTESETLIAVRPSSIRPGARLMSDGFDELFHLPLIVGVAAVFLPQSSLNQSGQITTSHMALLGRFALFAHPFCPNRQPASAMSLLRKVL